MDGVPHMPTPPILPGASFTYDFAVPDAGTFWYHPHYDDSEQLGRGLAGPLIIEEPTPPAVDRDLVWLLADWRLDDAARIDPRFDTLVDVAHGGRIGNTVTLNGKVPRDVAVAGHERLRLRLINSASARIFELAVAGHVPVVLAHDGQPVAAPAPVERVVLAPGQRVDLLLDCPHGLGKPGGDRFPVVDHGDGSAPPQRLLDLVYGASIRPAVLTEPVVLPPNPLPPVDLAGAVPCRIVLEGGAMGNLVQARLEGETLSMANLGRRGRAWALNGVAGSSHYHFDDPLLVLKVGQTGRLTVVNETAWPHPVHLHGFPVYEVSGQWRDTVLIYPGEAVDLAFVAEQPGTWMFHCHILEHQAGGMMGFVNVTP
jgi:FtsP/CotA-like multicopper oxidase with cupredoxin domain